MVRSPSRRKQGNVFRVGNSRDVTAQPVRVLNEVGAILGAEDAMHQIGSVGMRHTEIVVKVGIWHGDPRHIGMFVVPSLKGLYS